MRVVFLFLSVSCHFLLWAGANQAQAERGPRYRVQIQEYLVRKNQPVQVFCDQNDGLVKGTCLAPKSVALIAGKTYKPQRVGWSCHAQEVQKPVKATVSALCEKRF